MKKKITIALLFFVTASSFLLVSKGSLFLIDDYREPVSVNIKGYLGEKMRECLDNRIKKQDLQAITSPFSNRTETSLWQTEFWGKWMLAAVPAYQYSKDPKLLSMISASVKEIMSTQTPDGYIGNYAPDAHLKGWDVWGRKYTMLGLLEYYDITRDKAVLESAKRVADHLLSETGVGKAGILRAGFYHGMAAGSVLEPIVKLYERTNEKRYLDFAKYIVTQWETADGPQLISKAMKGVDVAERFPHPKEWWSWENGQKAYEMMSCYQGLLELYKVDPNPDYVKAAEAVAQNINTKEINIAGSGSAFECWYHGRQFQTEPTYHMMETCVTTTWMRLCQTLLKLTHQSQYADMLEKTLYNAYLASIAPDGSSFSKYSPLEGTRGAGEDQCGIEINCCIANGPRGFSLLPAALVTNDASGIFVNLYAESVATVDHHGEKITITQHTNYPVGDSVVVVVDPGKSRQLAISFRIPLWSKESAVTVNGQMINGTVAGGYQTLDREWKSGDSVVIKLDMRGRITRQNNYMAIERGPVVLARDARFNDGFIDETADLPNETDYIVLTPDPAPSPKNIWMSYTAQLILGTNREREFGKPRSVHFSDFASAGNTWSQASRYRVWLHKTLDVMNNIYTPY
jgi:DUF1680 family protein